MSQIIFDLALSGAKKIVTMADDMLKKAVSEKGESQKIEFPETAFYFPVAHALLGHEVKTLKDIQIPLNEAKALIKTEGFTNSKLAQLGVLDSGLAALLGTEIITGIRYLNNQEPQKDCNGFFSDTILRTLGIQLVDGRLPGFAAILGASKDSKTAVEIVREFQKRNILVFAGSATDGKSIIDQLIEEKVEMGWDNYIVPYGRDTVSAVYPLSWALRGAMTFGGIKPGNAAACLKYTKERVFAFALTLGNVDEFKVAAGAAAINLGFPVIADTDVPEIMHTGLCTYETLVKELDYKKIPQKCIDVRGVKVKISKIPVPVPFAAAFEGERVRKEQTHVEFGSKYSTAFEYLKMNEMKDVQDGLIKVIGPDADTVKPTETGPAALPLGIVVEVAGRKMQKDFEPVLERQIHHFINFAMGIFHMGQRDQIWVRISKDSFASGFRVKHFGEILRAKFLEDYPALVDKVQVTIYTDKKEIDKLLPEIQQAFNERDERLAGLTDDSVDTFYSCTLCQSYAPNHVCVISPEKLGLCGAYNWLDGKAAYEINPKGMNQPISKGDLLDPVNGEWQGVNKFVYDNSNKSIERFFNYAIMEFPTTSCGCFECIVAVLPECNGVMVVNRGYTGMTPIGMTFTSLASSVGGGSQTPGFLGVGRIYLASKKFLVPEGGFHRVVWMTKELKEVLSDRLKKRSQELDTPDFFDKIADETVTTDSAQLIEYLQKVDHPALKMPPIIK
ncbi:MAG: CO dehydrogenase/CO-methylating acetyl-CoA synthase complex subunit beta [Elusimicrobia bacterium RIFOXYA2_FULL_39_19]|nr:MAG: CO dehydrogenase/CO-methylating acetyl-CoA synthase complex subunit beta [Elusimicrobia bacterium RIFOXYA2_FULL_39_19]